MDRCRHGLRICSRCVTVTDAARRMSDTINGILTFANQWEIKDCWLAFKLADGSYDGNVYPDRDTAIRFQSNPNRCAFFCFRNALAGAKPLDCQLYLNLHRHAYDHGGGLTEPAAPQLIVPTTYYDKITGRVRGRR